jgi:lipopolysaccharide transport system ATP-binding protein
MGSITVTNLGKAYKQYPTRWSRLLEWITPGKSKRHHLKWVLKDINFTVNPGEAVGIVGINGAGKSTLLKMITGTTQPTVGNIEIKGRVSALLELGMGFHPEFTGRQNAYMACQLAGLAHDEIERLLPEIETFADIGEYFDQPIRVYSSGMQARVAFAVSTSFVPDILIVDEALSVGDSRFQLKCQMKFQELKSKGTTLLLVSHSPGDIVKMTSKAIWIDQGGLRKVGTSKEIVEEYIAETVHKVSLIDQSLSLSKSEPSDSLVMKPLHEKATINGTGGAVIDAVGIFNQENNFVTALYEPCEIKVTFSVNTNVDVTSPWVGFSFVNTKGVRVFGANSYGLNASMKPLSAGDTRFYTFKFQFPEIENGAYLLSVAINDGTPEEHVRLFNVLDAYQIEFSSRHLHQLQQSILKINNCILSEATKV